MYIYYQTSAAGWKIWYLQISLLQNLYLFLLVAHLLQAAFIVGSLLDLI